jgi:hypothetical protein
MFRRLLRQLFLWRLKRERPAVIRLGLDTAVMDNDEARVARLYPSIIFGLIFDTKDALLRALRPSERLTAAVHSVRRLLDRGFCGQIAQFRFKIPPTRDRAGTRATDPGPGPSGRAPRPGQSPGRR